MNSEYITQEAEIEIRTKLGDKKVVFTATAPSVEINSEVSYDGSETFYDLDSAKLFRDSTFTTLSAQLNDGWKYVVREKVPVIVHRTASVLAADRTVEAFEQARKRAGAPKSAKISVGDYMRMSNELVVENLDEPRPVNVEFRWKEEVE